MGPGFRPEPLPPRCMEPARLARSWAVQFRAGLNILTFCNTARNPEVRYCVILMPIRPSLPPRLSRPAKRIVAHAPLSHPEFSLPCRPCGCRSHGGSPGPPPRRRADPQRAPAQLAQSRQRRPGRRAGEPRQPLRPDRVLYGPAAVAEHARPLRGERPARPDWRPLHRGAQSDRSRRLRRAELPALKIGVRTCRAGYGTSRRRTLDLYKLIRDGLLRPSSGTLTWTYVGSSERVGSTVIRSSWATSAPGCTCTTSQPGSDYWIELATTPQPFGGRRWWFVCPQDRRQLGLFQTSPRSCAGWRGPASVMH